MKRSDLHAIFGLVFALACVAGYVAIHYMDRVYR